MSEPILTSEVQAQQNSVGQDGTALNEVSLQQKLQDYLTVSGGYISTERDQLGNIMLHEDPNNVGSNKQLVTQWMSVDIQRRDYDDEQLQKVFDTEINELFKPPKTKTAEELRAEIERLRQLLADAEGDIIVQEVVIGGDGTSGTSGTSGTGGTSGGGEPESILIEGDREAPFSFDVEGFVFDVETSIWFTDELVLRSELAPKVQIAYSVFTDEVSGNLIARFKTKVPNPEYWQGWFYDKENLGVVGNYQSQGTGDTIELVLGSNRPEMATDANPTIYRISAAFKNQAPPVVTTDRIKIQTAEYLAFTDEFNGKKDVISAPCMWTLYDASGKNIVRKSDETVQTPFEINVSPGQLLSLQVIRASQIFAQTPIEGWYRVTDANTYEQITYGFGGGYNNTLTYSIPSDIKGILIAYDPT